jgi:leucyl aminopeptidase
MQIRIQTGPPADAGRVLFAWAGAGGAEWFASSRDLRPVLDEIRLRTRFKGTAGSALFWPLPPGAGAPALIVAGAGSKATAAVGVERAAAAAAQIARKNRIPALAFELSDGPAAKGLDASLFAFRIARGVREGDYRFESYLSDLTSTGPALQRIVFWGAGAGAVAKAARQGAKEGAVFNEVRDLANQPGNVATPAAIADVATDLARRYGLRCTVLKRSELEKAGFRALLAVSQGSRNDPRLIVLEHAGKRPSSQQPLVFIGKTLTFDSGGLSIKPSKGMEWMRYDKCGGMAVLAAMAAAGALSLPIPAVGILVAAENMPDGNATRPGDIIRSLGGPTIEILNTDAEGRLVLADALAWSKRFRPAAIVDLATLTGAAVVALGHAAAALLSTDDALSDRLRNLGERSGDRLWPLPLWPEYDSALESPFADLKNIGDGSAGTISGAAFLKRFVPPDVPWAHLDIAGTAWEEKETSWRSPGATLFGARLITEWLRQPERKT